MLKKVTITDKKLKYYENQLSSYFTLKSIMVKDYYYVRVFRFQQAPDSAVSEQKFLRMIIACVSDRYFSLLHGTYVLPGHI